jgi:hypothetical protein
VLTVADHRKVKVGREAGRQEVLSRYLAMVYSMRGIDPGTHITLRLDDLDVLGSALHLRPRDAAADLEALMDDPGEIVSERVSILRSKLLVPAAGILVALLTAGTLVLVEQRAGADAGTPAPVSISTAAVQARNPDGTPGPVQVRNG